MKVNLAHLSLTAWVAWLLALGIMAGLSYGRVLHPSFLYMAVPLGIQVICTVAVLGGGIWRIFRGPRRGRAAAWMLIGVLPTLWMAAYVEYAFAFIAGQHHRPNALIRLSEAGISLLAEPYIRVCYPHQYEGERFVLWSDSPRFDKEEMAAMDAHIRAMEKALGGQPRYQVYWVCGPVWGIGGRGGSGWAIGVNPSLPNAITDRVGRHEAAHVVLDEFCPFGSEVPMLLHEGWAELHSKPKPESRWQECWISQREGELPNLRALTGPEYYFNSIDPMYSLGSVLVEYILKRFGHEKFLELCTTCREATFAEDVERVLGVSLDELDRAYQQDLAQRRRELSAKENLLSAKLAEGVDRDRWRRLVEEVCAGLDRFVSAADPMSVTVVETFDNIEKDGKTTTGRHRIEYFLDGKRYAIRRSFPEGSNVEVITPGEVFDLEKKPDDKSWQLKSCSVQDRRNSVAMPQSRMKPLFLWHRDGLPFYWPCRGVTITGMRVRDPDSGIVRVSFVETHEGGGRWARMQGWMDLDPKCDYGIIEKQFDGFDEKGKPTASSHITFHYETIDGRHVPKTIGCENHDAAGGSSRQNTAVESCRLGPPSAKVFELASYGDFPLPASPPEPRAPVYTLTWVAAGITLLTLLLAACLKLKSVRCRRCTRLTAGGSPS
jgi:hypothetical protein